MEQARNDRDGTPRFKTMTDLELTTGNDY
jgi:hypothetical protein